MIVSVTVEVRLSSQKKKQMRDEVGRNKDASSRFYRLITFFVFSGCIYMDYYHSFGSSGMTSGHRQYDTYGIYVCIERII